MAESEWTITTLHDKLAGDLSALKELIAQQRTEDAKALVLQAAETERRLAALNHAHEEAVQVQHTYVTEEKYEALHKNIEDKYDSQNNAIVARLDNVEKAIVTLNAQTAGRRAGDQDRDVQGTRTRGLVFGAIAAAVAVISLLLGVRTAHVTVQPTTPVTVAR
jgi:hypothetical protein